MGKIFNKGNEIRVEAHSGEDTKEPVLINAIIGFGLIEADDEAIRVGDFRQVGDHGGKAGMFSNETTWDKTFLIVVESVDSPRRQSIVDEISIHLTISVHGGNGAIVSSECRVAFFEE